MELLVCLETQVPREKWVPEEIRVSEERLEKME